MHRGQEKSEEEVAACNSHDAVKIASFLMLESGYHPGGQACWT